MNFNFVAKTFHGLEEILAKELENLGAENIKIHKRAVSFDGDKFFYYKANYWLRTALNILVPIAHGKIKNEIELYNLVKKIEWENFMSVDSTLAVQSTVHSEHFNHSKYVALKAKDAIVDRFREKFGRRPNVDVERPNLTIHIHIDREYCDISLDSSGEPLFKRGYRTDTNIAPINEVLAAGMIQLSTWDMTNTLYDPMCGSGTIPIEAALMAANKPPQVARKFFAFMNWPDFSRHHWDLIKQGAFENIQTPNCKIKASDQSVQAIRIATENARNAGVIEFIDFDRVTFELSEAPEGEGVIVTNPPYGERLKPEIEIIDLYKRIGDTLKTRYLGYEAFIISSNFDALKQVGLKPTRKIVLYNGSLECKYHQFSIYKGSKKGKYLNPEE